jgi:hypothetical protein
MSLTAMWTHGSSVTIETPGSFSSISRFGFGTDTFLNVDQESLDACRDTNANDTT